MRQGAVAALGVTAGLAAFHYLPLGMLSKQTTTNSVNQPSIQMSSIGESVSQEEAIIRASFPISVPSSLPQGTTLNEARIAADGAMVGLLYNSRLLEPLNLYADPIDIAIFQIKEDVISSPPAFLPKGFDRIAVNGNPGFARPQSKQPSEPGQLQWWSNGRRCSIFANLSIAELLKIANSMEAQTHA